MPYIILDSARKRGYTREEIINAFEKPIGDWDKPDREGIPGRLAVGWSSGTDSHLITVIAKFEGEYIVVYHVGESTQAELRQAGLR